MGGGIVQRYAMSDAAKLADAYLLFAPALGRGLPGEVLPPNVKLHMPRILGIFMLNAVGVKRFNHLPAINFGFPEFNGHINQYTFNATLSMRPETFEKGIAALQKPALVILGANDTTSGVAVDTAVAAIREHSAAEVVVIPGQGHHVQNSPDAVAEAADWLRKFLERN
jgi:pimeloyl-ACP methyl ester carboxylesterase